MAIATFEMATAEASFPAGTVGGDWHWVLSDGTAVVKDWKTSEPFADAEVAEETAYKISAQRMDADKGPLGPVVSASFTTETDPVEVIIDVAQAISVAIDGVPTKPGPTPK